MRQVLLLLAILAIAVALEFTFRHQEPDGSEERRTPEPDRPAPAMVASVPGKPTPAIATPRPQTPRKPMVMADVAANAEQLNDPDSTVDEDLQIVGELLRVYTRYIGSAPEGGLNEEIVACFRGKNPMKITFLGSDNAKLNEAGELLDRFGTPYYFHPVSADQIEVRSAGPDQKLWSNDDVLLD